MDNRINHSDSRGESSVEGEFRKEYRTPELVEYGGLRELTLGATGPQGDPGAAGFGKQP